MPQDWISRGVPMALQTDGWWLTDPAPPATDQTTVRKGPLMALLALLLLADILFWHQTPGVSLAMFAVAVFAATAKGRPQPIALAVLTLSVLPVVEYVQALSLTILLAGLSASIALNRGAAPLTALVSWLCRVPTSGLRDLLQTLRHLARLPARTWARNWAFPLGGTLILLSLLTQANPVLADWIATLTNLPLDPVDLTLRAVFWAGMALIIWPLLTEAPEASLTLPNLGLPRIGLPRIGLPRIGLNATSVANALILFNALLALQTALDARYLWTGTAPAGMTLATYVHRGAYPLLATALLAGAFALAARPWLAERPLLKPLLLLWLAQNVLLTLSALYRLDLYVDAFGLTYLRAHAAIWMALVTAGLALTLTQIALQKSNRWLLIRCSVLGAATLYICAFINFADIIARVNVAEDKVDPAYICSLGPTAAAAIPADLPGTDISCLPNQPQITNWRDWGFRNWRVIHTLRAQEAAHEDPRRG